MNEQPTIAEVTAATQEVLPDLAESLAAVFACIHGRVPQSSAELGLWVEEVGRAICELRQADAPEQES